VAKVTGISQSFPGADVNVPSAAEPRLLVESAAPGAWTWIAVAAVLLIALAAVVASLVLARRLRDARHRLAEQVAAREQAQRSLAEREGRLQTIFECQPECVKLHADDGTILAMNPAGLAMIGAQSAEQVIGKSVYEFIAPEHRERYHAVSAAVFDGRPDAMEFRLLGFRGRQRMIETRVVPMRDDAGAVVAALALTRDITERQAAEERARRHLSELARVARISSMGEMASGIAHELNQPLTAIVNHASACLRRLGIQRDRDADVIESLQEIATQGQRAGQIIRNVRNLVSRSEPCTTAVDINEVVRTMVGLAEPEAKRHGVVVRAELDAALAPVRARRIEIEQVVFNLLRNAIEAMSGPSVIATPAAAVSVATRRGADGAVEVSVQDRGSGIAAEDRDRVFDPFFTTKSDGMGMGLSISRSIIEAHEGRLTVRSNSESGVTFTFTLPAVKEAATA
jgi:PAS domain S-box-containing protein